MLLKGKQQITTQQDNEAAPSLLSFSKQPCSSSVIGLKMGRENRKTQEKTEKITKNLEVQNNLPTFAPVFHQRT